MLKQYVLEKLNIQLSESQLHQFDTFCDILLCENQKYNLTAIVEREQVFEKHFADSLLGSFFIAQNCSVCDVGSGAGFPAIPLKIARPDLHITAVDSLQKRINFLNQTATALGIKMNTVHSRTEDFSHTCNRQSFDVVTARAVAPLNTLLEYCSALAKIGGVVLAYKTDDSEVADSKNAQTQLGLKFSTAKHFELPSGDKRCLLVFEKVCFTPLKFPRGQNKPRTKPL